MPFGFGIGLVSTDQIADGSITNAKVNAAAAIAYAKLALGTSIVNADIAAGAAIAYAKLALGTSIVNADIAAGAAIAYAKLALGTSIVNADIAAGAAIAESKINPVPGTALATHAGLVLTHGAALALAGYQFNTYAGNSTVNKAVAHGLGKIPRLVMIIGANTDIDFSYGFILANLAKSVGCDVNAGADASRSYVQTAMDATNFYVGNATDYGLSLNITGQTYYWIALG